MALALVRLLWLLLWGAQVSRAQPILANIFLMTGILLSSSIYAAPTTGVVREYEFNITRGIIAPDGMVKSALLINNMFPGPAIEANFGDTFKIVVNNMIENPGDGTSIHWHGILQKGTPWYDGASTGTQCPIAPGKSMTYIFKAHTHGVSFYHAHYSSQYIDGLFGPMIIHGPTTIHYDVDLGPVLLTDYYGATYLENVALLDGTSGAPPPQSVNNLINGRNFNGTCTSEACAPSVFHFQPGKVHKISLVNAGAEGLQWVSIDNHHLTVISNDFVQIHPYKTDVLKLGVGQRADVLVTATGHPGDAVWMRSDMSTSCAKTAQPHALAIIRYPEAPADSIPSSTGYVIDDSSCGNEPISKLVPLERRPRPRHATTVSLTITLAADAEGRSRWFVNNSTYAGDYDRPLLLDLMNAATSASLLSSPPPSYNLYNFHNDAGIRLIFINPAGSPHPMHLHGHEFFVLAEGRGTWNGTITNPWNPARKDTHQIPSGSPHLPAYLVIEFVADNPGVWPLHCHMSWHLSRGLYINILDHPEVVQKMRFPREVEQTCEDWRAWSKANNSTEIGPDT